MNRQLYELLEANPIIAAIKDDEGLNRVTESDAAIIFVLYGDILSITDIVTKLKNAGKTVFVHADLIHGFSSREIVVDYIKQQTHADGVISTKPGIIKRASELGLCGIFRVFLIDSLALGSIEKQYKLANADIVEILPGVMPKIIKSVSHDLKIPIIAGGLIRDKEDVMEALKAGAIAISSTNPNVWFL